MLVFCPLVGYIVGCCLLFLGGRTGSYVAFLVVLVVSTDGSVGVE